jgi:hypothetical protein
MTLDAIYQKSDILKWGKPCILPSRIAYFPAGRVKKEEFFLKNKQNYIILNSFLK